MVILFTTDQYLPTTNGVVTQVLAIRRELEKRGHRVIILTEHYTGQEEEEKDVYRLPTIVFPLRKADRLAWPFSRKIDEILANEPIDIIHNHFFVTGFFGKRVAERKNIPSVATLHTLFTEYFNYVFPLGTQILKPFYFSAARSYLKSFDLLLAPSKKAVEELEKVKEKEKVKLFYNGFDFSIFKNASADEFRKKFKLSSETPLAIVVGRVDKGKNVDLIVEAFAQINKELPESKLAVVGDGLERSKVEALIKKLGLEESVFLTGYLSQELTASAYKASNVLLFASTVDTLPSVMVEAESVGVPVVSVWDKATQDLVKDKENGFFVEKTASALATGALKILQDKKLAAQMGKESENLAKNFSIENYVDALENIYKDLIKQRQDSV